MKKEKMFELNGECLIINLPEELDHHTAKVIRDETDELFSSKKIRNVIFNYENTVFMDSSGIGLVMGRYREVRYLKGNVYLVGITDKMERYIQISGLHRIAKRKNTVEDAMREVCKI